MTRAFTAEQADAIARREGDLMLSANAGSGKTSVLVERFVASVVHDGLRADDHPLQAVRGIRSGALVPDPTACAYRGGCAHPTICRCEAASA